MHFGNCVNEFWCSLRFGNIHQCLLVVFRQWLSIYRQFLRLPVSQFEKLYLRRWRKSVRSTFLPWSALLAPRLNAYTVWRSTFSTGAGKWHVSRHYIAIKAPSLEMLSIPLTGSTERFNYLFLELLMDFFITTVYLAIPMIDLQFILNFSQWFFRMQLHLSAYLCSGHIWSILLADDLLSVVFSSPEERANCALSCWVNAAAFRPNLKWRGLVLITISRFPIPLSFMEKIWHLAINLN